MKNTSSKILYCFHRTQILKKKLVIINMNYKILQRETNLRREDKEMDLKFKVQ